MKLFGTDGIRGVPNKAPLTPEGCVRIGRAAARYFLKHLNLTSIVIGRDTRHSGNMIESALATGFSSEGMNVVKAGVIPSPGIAFTAQKNKFAGCVVSASHNPASDNGIKFFKADGRKLSEDEEKKIEEYYFSDDIEKMRLPVEMLGRIDPVNPEYIQIYKEFLKDFIKDFPRMNNAKIVIDCANGAACGIAEDIFSKLGAKLIIINSTPDGFNINENCGATSVEGLRKTVLEKNALLGIAFDGDADRVVMIDEKGNNVDGDSLLFVTALHMMKKNKLPEKKIVATEYSNYGLDQSLRKFNIDVVRVLNGDRFVEREMTNLNCPLGGENSGHIILGEYARTGDGMLTALSILRIMGESETKLSELASGMQRLPQKLVNIEVAEKKDFSEIKGLKSKMDDAKNMLGDSGRILIRYSGTQNLCRVLVEAEDVNLVERISTEISEHIKNQSG